jgi:hypothetical protein
MFRESPKLGVRVKRIPAAVPRLISYYVFAEQGNREHSGQEICTEGKMLFRRPRLVMGSGHG